MNVVYHRILINFIILFILMLEKYLKNSNQHLKKIIDIHYSKHGYIISLFSFCKLLIIINNLNLI